MNKTLTKMSSRQIQHILRDELRNQKLKHRSMAYLADRHLSELKKYAALKNFEQIDIQSRLHSEFCREQHISSVEITRLEKELKYQQPAPNRVAKFVMKLKMRFNL